MKLFGYTFSVSPQEEREKEALKAITPNPNDGSLVVDQSVTSPDGALGDAMAYSVALDVDADAISEYALITKYREIALLPEVEYAIDDIINAFVDSDSNTPVKIDLDELNYSPAIKKKIVEEFDYVLDLLDFNANAYKIIRRWYVDGRLPYQVVVNPDKYKTEGIGRLVYIDPRLLRKVRVVKRDKDMRTGVDVYYDKDEFYLFSETGFNLNTPPQTVSAFSDQGVRLSKESVVYATSGLLNPSNSVVLSYLHKAIRPLNQLKSLEDAAIIYRLARAPERRVFYIDVGNLPPAKAEQHLRSQMQQYRSKMIYDTATGTVRTDPKQMTMIEDFWLPRRGDGKATEISTLPGGQNLGEMDEVNYFLNKVYKALGVPISRLDPQAGFNFGRVTEINRDELKFMKFIARLRREFSILFHELLRRQLALKNILNPDEYDRVKNKITYEYASDDIFEESKNNEIMIARLDVLSRLAPNEPIIGTYYSKEWVRRNILYQSQEEIAEILTQIAKEKEAGEYDDQVENKAREIFGDDFDNPTPSGNDGGGGTSVSFDPGKEGSQVSFTVKSTNTKPVSTRSKRSKLVKPSNQ